MRGPDFIVNMSTLLHPPLLQSFARRHDTRDSIVKDGKQEPGSLPLRSKSSLASLVQFVQNPLEHVSETVENWYEGNTKEERARKRSIDDKKQVLYLRLRNVGTSG